MTPDYTQVTEVPGLRVSRENLAMAVTRYGFAAHLAAGGDVLEVGCGRGQGLGWLAQGARRLVGADYTAALLDGARRHYGERIPLVRLTGDALPFRAASFDVVVALEAIYYMPDPAGFARECRRVLRPGGAVLVATVNPAWPDFNPSPLSTRYLTASMLEATLGAAGFAVELSAAFPVRRHTGFERTVSLVKRTAVRLRVMPRTMKGKTLLKRLAFGPLVPYPVELDAALVPEAPRSAVAACETAGFKVIYAVGRVPL